MIFPMGILSLSSSDSTSMKVFFTVTFTSAAAVPHGEDWPEEVARDSQVAASSSHWCWFLGVKCMEQRQLQSWRSRQTASFFPLKRSSQKLTDKSPATQELRVFTAKPLYPSGQTPFSPKFGTDLRKPRWASIGPTGPQSSRLKCFRFMAVFWKGSSKREGLSFHVNSKMIPHGFEDPSVHFTYVASLKSR